MSKFSTEELSILSKSLLFNGLSFQEIQAVTNYCQNKTFRKGDNIIKEGEKGRGLFIILQGKVNVFLPKEYMGGSRPTEVHITDFGVGKFFGEFSLVDEGTVSASIRAETDLRTCLFSIMDFEEFANSNHKLSKIIYKNMLKKVISQLRDNTKEFDMLLVSG